jgi:hypothetical protein
MNFIDPSRGLFTGILSPRAAPQRLARRRYRPVPNV